MDEQEHEFCGRYLKRGNYPAIIDGALIAMAQGISDDVVCKAHGPERGWDEVLRDDAVEKAGAPNEAKLLAEGFEIFRAPHCTLPWDDDNPIFNVGAMLFIDEE